MISDSLITSNKSEIANGLKKFFQDKVYKLSKEPNVDKVIKVLYRKYKTLKTETLKM